ncbi:hypothetical protein TNCV_3194081 [Trichonephila clavipes]|uniref:Uncharacterized protein n=1 Tax=Trichonephila clavipes TaxID=2585209 RepID=A0A8X6R9G7_TRICX|nr:hypothetical protein TNCV_3194081 [Trichonephila clavipes]
MAPKLAPDSLCFPTTPKEGLRATPSTSINPLLYGCVKVTGQLIAPPYYVRGTATQLITIAMTYCLKNQWVWDQDEECRMQIRYIHQSEIIGGVKEARSGGLRGWFEKWRGASSSSAFLLLRALVGEVVG